MYNAYFRFSISESSVCAARMWPLQTKKWKSLGNTEPQSADLVLYYLDKTCRNDPRNGFGPRIHVLPCGDLEEYLNPEDNAYLTI
jgi:hypothetical protein